MTFRLFAAHHSIRKAKARKPDIFRPSGDNPGRSGDKSAPRLSPIKLETWALISTTAALCVAGWAVLS